MATLERLISEVRRAFGNKRIWLTEYGYQTRPHDRTILGVSQTKQAQYLAEASLRAYRAPFVDVLIKYMVIDDGRADGWQSGLYTATGAAKLSAKSFPMPLAQVPRRGAYDRVGPAPRRQRQAELPAAHAAWRQVDVGGRQPPHELARLLLGCPPGEPRRPCRPGTRAPAATAPRSSSASGTLRSGRSRPRSGSGSRRGAWRLLAALARARSGLRTNGSRCEVGWRGRSSSPSST